MIVEKFHTVETFFKIFRGLLMASFQKHYQYIPSLGESIEIQPGIYYFTLPKIKSKKIHLLQIVTEDNNFIKILILEVYYETPNEEFVLKSYVDDQIANVPTGGEIDLSNYATKTEIEYSSILKNRRLRIVKRNNNIYNYSYIWWQIMDNR